MIRVQENERVLLRIIPHSSTLNSSNRRLWYMLHELLTVYDSPWSRLSRDGWGWVLRAPDDIWWVTLMATDPSSGGEPPRQRIEFYVMLPAKFAEVFLIKVKNHPQWSRCTVQEVPWDQVTLPSADSDLYALKYRRANMFSLQYNYSEQASPIRSILHVTREMRPGDKATLCFRFEGIGRRRWKALVDYEWSVWERGLYPERAGFDVGRLYRQALRLTTWIINGVKGVADDIVGALERAFFPGDGQPLSKATDGMITLPDPEREALLVNGRLSHETSNKRNLPAFVVNLQMIISADSEARRTMLAHSLAGGFSELAGDNRLELARVNPQHLERATVLRAPRWDRDPNVMSVDEVGKVVQLPTAEVQAEFLDAMEANRNVEIPVPEPFLDTTGILAGTATVRGEPFPAHVPTRDLDMLMTPRVFMGSPRMGKDVAVVNYIVEARLHHGIGAVILDVIDERRGHRGMSDALRDHLPPEHLIDLDLSDFDHPVGLALRLGNGANDRIARSRIAQELTNFFMADDIENHQTREFLRECAKAVGGDLVGIKLMLTNPDFRRARIAEMKRLGRDTTLLEDLDGMQEGRRGQIAGPILVRLGDIMGDEALRPLFCQTPRPEVNLGQWMREGKVVIYRIPKRDLGEMATRLLCHWIILNTYLTKLSLGGEGAPTYLVLNEPHQYLSRGFVHFTKNLLAEGPKYRVAPLLIFHHFQQFRSYPEFVDILLASSLNWHLFKNTADTVYERLRTYLEPTFTPEMAQQATKRFHFIACWLAPNGEYQPPFMVEAPRPVWDRYPTRDHSWLTKRHSRIYGRPIGEVERDIQARQKATAG